MRSAIVVSVCCLLMVTQMVSSAPGPDPNWLDQLFRSPSGGGSGRTYYGQSRPAAASNRQPRDRFKPICRVINGDNYAFPGRVPYPSAPFCPYGD